MILKIQNDKWCIVDKNGNVLLSSVSNSQELAIKKVTLHHTWNEMKKKGYKCINVNLMIEDRNKED